MIPWKKVHSRYKRLVWFVVLLGLLVSWVVVYHKTKTNKSLFVEFPKELDSSKCGDIAIWRDYALHHKRVLSGEEKGNYLVYECNQFACGGFGNRIMGLTATLLFSIAFRRVFLINHTFPINLDTVMQPNAIQWNKHLTSEQLQNAQNFKLIDAEGNEPVLFELAWYLMEQFSGVITVQANLEFPFFIHKMPKVFLKHYKKFFDDRSIVFDALYGCSYRYLFKYLPFVEEAIDKEMKLFNFNHRQFVSVHIRLYKHEKLDIVKKWIGCTLATANSSQEYLPIYVMTNEEFAINYLTKTYPGRLSYSKIRGVSIDQDETEYSSDTGYMTYSLVSLITNVEVAAKAKVFIKSHSTLSNVIAGIGGFALYTDAYQREDIKDYCVHSDIVTKFYCTDCFT